ncbi:GntR family transcriptional regulator [Kitasatospora sp. NBC_00240]|uniref:GntR family transcriptional regulator n=1 Tax=Kitasatospora sp. NBC_00240 TaxID=2903567 RepID=UPI00225B0DFB|nr:GntR family transcriptional regulator [Kitasatospora sp. NBC_00240]MCX5213561.1 GntR family transcriptional regulator [Kitasatospora sp. NBC_00240]
MTSGTTTAPGTDGASARPLDQVVLERTSIPERVAAVLRSWIAEARLPPGVRLSEERICAELAISRNTLREAFRLLTHERLLLHRLNRGVFVRVLGVEDVEDLYRVRKLVEPAAVRELRGRPAGLDRVAAALAEADAAGARQDWFGLGTADLHFHRALTALAGSPRVDELMDRVLAELRLVFHVVPDLRSFHQRCREENRRILALLEAGDGAGAAEALTGCLDSAERELVTAYRERPRASL